MHARRRHGRRRMMRRLLPVGVLAAGMLAVGSSSAMAAVTSSFSSGTLSVFGDSLDNNVTVSRNAAGTLLVNGGAVPIAGGTPTVANTTLIQAFGQTGNDTITLSEINGALPRANLFGGADNDTLTGGSGIDQLFGQGGNDTILGRGGGDLLFGGADNDTLTGGDADDQVFGESGNDRMVWNPGDDTDLTGGGDGTDTVEVNGGGGAEQFTATANGTRVRFDRLTPAPFALDVGTSENLVLNANGGNDTFSATGNLAALIQITVDGGTGNDTLLGSNGVDLLIGGEGDDSVDGQQGNDVAFLGAGTDRFRWDPGDGSDVIEGQDGVDRLVFNGSNASENMAVSANGQRVLFTRDVAAIAMDVDDVEIVLARSFGGADRVVVNDLTGTDVTTVTSAIAAVGGADDAQPDNVVVNATTGSDSASVIASGRNAQVRGLAPRVALTGAGAGDRVTVDTLAGDDVIDASETVAGAIALTLHGGSDDDLIVGGAGSDVITGGAGDDFLIGGPGSDVVDGGPDDDIVVRSTGADTTTSGSLVGSDWLTDHAEVRRDRTVLRVDGKRWTLPRADLAALVADANAS